MALLDRRDYSFFDAVSRLGYYNPFLPERVEYERQVLGPAFEEGEPVWSMRVADPDEPRANAWKVAERIETAIGDVRERIPKAPETSERDLVLYEDAVLYLLYHRYADHLFRAVSSGSHERSAGSRWDFYEGFSRDWEHYFAIPGVALPTQHEAVHTFSCFFQISRAFVQIFAKIIGSSMSAARCLHRGCRRPPRLARNLPTHRHGVPRRDWRSRSRHSGEAPACDRNAVVPAGGRYDKSPF
jgi:hypothetical protein